MRTLDINNWNRKQHFKHFNALLDSSFAVTLQVNVTKAYSFAKENKISFFTKYLHDCMKAVNAIENLKYRIVDNNIVVYDVIHASATFMRKDNTFGFSFVEFDDDINIFADNVLLEKNRIENSTHLYPPYNGLDCIHCSVLPWLNFTGHKETYSGKKDSVPKVAFSKTDKVDGKLMMNVAVNVNHALVDGYHVGLFIDYFQMNLNS